jgi:hypothetical protein
VEARLAEQPGGWDHSTTTVSGGTYAMFGLPTGDYVVRVIAPGYAREYYDNVIPSIEATIVHVTALSEMPGIDFDLTEGGSISGYVYDKAGNPIEGAEIQVTLSGEWSSDGFFTATASDGRYVIENLALGEYKVGAEAEGWLRQVYGNHYNLGSAPNIPVVPPNTTTSIDFHLGRGGSVSGFVYESDGVTPAEGVAILIWSELPDGELIGFGSTTGPDGSFLVTDIFPWSYKVQASKPGFATEWYDSRNNCVDADAVVVEEGSTVSDILFTLDPGGLVTGHVYGEDGKPISGVRVHAHLTTGEWVTLSDLTDLDGGYSLWLSTHRYFAVTNPCDRGDRWVGEWYSNTYQMANATPVNVVAPDETSGIDFYLAEAGSISGHVYEEDGTTPIAGAGVYAFPITGDYPGAGANTDPDGGYTIKGLPSGTYRVQVTVSGHAPQFYRYATDEASATAVTVNAPNDTPDIDFALSPVSE